MKVFEIRNVLASTSHGCLDIALYFSKLKKLWYKFRFVSSYRGCSSIYAANCDLQKEDEENRLHQFLICLNEPYVGVRRNLFMMHPLSSLDNAYNVLL